MEIFTAVQIRKNIPDGNICIPTDYRSSLHDILTYKSSSFLLYSLPTPKKYSFSNLKTLSYITKRVDELTNGAQNCTDGNFKNLF